MYICYYNSTLTILKLTSHISTIKTQYKETEETLLGYNFCLDTERKGTHGYSIIANPTNEISEICNTL